MSTTQSRARNNPDKQNKFLAEYERCCHISQAAEAAGIERRSHYYWLQHDPDYRQRFEQSDAIAIRALEDEAARRAMHGVDEPVFHQGEVCGTVRKYSDRLLEFLLKGRDPSRYGDRFRQELSGPGGGPVEVRTLMPVFDTPKDNEPDSAD